MASMDAEVVEVVDEIVEGVKDTVNVEGCSEIPVVEPEPEDARRQRVLSEISSWNGDQEPPFMRAVHAVYTLGEKHLEEFGGEVVYSCYRMLQSCFGEIRVFVAKTIEVMGKKLQGHLVSLENVGGELYPGRILDLMIGICACENLGGNYGSLRVEIDNYLRNSPLETIDFVAFDVVNGLPTDREPTESRYSILSQFFFVAYFSKEAGFNLGATIAQGVKYLIDVVYPYKDIEKMAYHTWKDQLELIYTFMTVLSDYGVYKIDSVLLPNEFQFLHREEVLDSCIERHDVEGVGFICTCLRIFGLNEDDSILRKGCQYIISRQKTNGTFGDPDGVEDGYERFMRHMACTTALNKPRFKGFGPTSEAIFLRIVKYLRNHGFLRDHEGEVLMPCGLFTRPMVEMKGLHEQYDGSSQGIGGDLGLPIQNRAAYRLQGLLLWRKRNQTVSANNVPSRIVGKGGAEKSQGAPAFLRVPSSAEDLAMREYFLRTILEKGVPGGKVSFGDVEVDLYRLYQAVNARGGYNKITDIQEWNGIARELGVPADMFERARRLRELYSHYLLKIADDLAKPPTRKLPASGGASGGKVKPLPSKSSTVMKPSGTNLAREFQGLGDEYQMSMAPGDRLPRSIPTSTGPLNLGQLAAAPLNPNPSVLTQSTNQSTNPMTALRGMPTMNQFNTSTQQMSQLPQLTPMQLNQLSQSMGQLGQLGQYSQFGQLGNLNLFSNTGSAMQYPGFFPLNMMPSMMQGGMSSGISSGVGSAAPMGISSHSAASSRSLPVSSVTPNVTASGISHNLPTSSSGIVQGPFQIGAGSHPSQGARGPLPQGSPLTPFTSPLQAMVASSTAASISSTSTIDQGGPSLAAASTTGVSLVSPGNQPSSSTSSSAEGPSSQPSTTTTTTKATNPSKKIKLI